MARKTKIVATLGPATADAATIGRMVGAGLDVARLNFSHGDHDSHRLLFRWVREAAREHDRPVAVLQDIQGPRIRVGTFEGGSVDLAEGEEVRLVAGGELGDGKTVYIEELDRISLDQGDRVLCADGMVELRVRDADEGSALAEVVVGGRLGDRKGVAFPDAETGLAAVTPKDESDLAFGREIGVDLVAASFVTSGGDVRQVRSLAGEAPVIAKIERARAYENLSEILESADGAMVARGDLGVELGFEPLPRVQKEIITRTHDAGGISITATEMLESMTAANRPTRAEVTDVANAVLDGTDAVMLSAETAVGAYPVRTVEVMSAICLEAEKSPDYPGPAPRGFLEADKPFPAAIARAAAETANALGLGTVVAFTETGSTARLVSRFRPNARIVAFSPVDETTRRLAPVWGVTPLGFSRYDSTDEMIAAAEVLLLDRGLVAPGEWVAMVAGVPPNELASTNLLKLHVIAGGRRLE